MKQYEAVVEAMRQLGGYATFSQLNHKSLQVEGAKWGTKTPFASIRRIVQVHNESFFRIRPGLWGLAEEKEAILHRLNLQAVSAPREQTEEFDHGYYQGLLVELGNLQCKTCVPAGDKNRRFLETPLKNLVTLEETPQFTYLELLRFAKTIDVGWFVPRTSSEVLLPHSLYEVEHSTDIQNSLLKFLELQDFHTQFYIVADAARRREWEDKMSRSAFKPLEKRVEFLDYEKLVSRHENAMKLAALS